MDAILADNLSDAAFICVWATWLKNFFPFSMPLLAFAIPECLVPAVLIFVPWDTKRRMKALSFPR